MDSTLYRGGRAPSEVTCVPLRSVATDGGLKSYILYNIRTSIKMLAITKWYEIFEENIIIIILYIHIYYKIVI